MAASVECSSRGAPFGVEALLDHCPTSSTEASAGGSFRARNATRNARLRCSQAESLGLEICPSNHGLPCPALKFARSLALFMRGTTADIGRLQTVRRSVRYRRGATRVRFASDPERT